MRLAAPTGFEWDGLREFFALREIAGLEWVETDRYRRKLALGMLEVRFGNGVEVHGPEDAEPRVRRMFDLDTESPQVLRALRRDPLLRRALAGVTDLRLPGCWDPFEVAVRAIVGQQISVAAARTFLGRIVSRFGGFPGPAMLADADLREIGLVRTRAETISRLAQAIDQGQIGFQVEELRTVKGIGDWTAQYIAMRALGAADAFPASDLVLRNVASESSEALTERELWTKAEAWRPYRAYAVIALWRYAARRKQ